MLNYHYLKKSQEDNYQKLAENGGPIRSFPPWSEQDENLSYQSEKAKE